MYVPRTTRKGTKAGTGKGDGAGSDGDVARSSARAKSSAAVDDPRDLGTYLRRRDFLGALTLLRLQEQDVLSPRSTPGVVGKSQLNSGDSCNSTNSSSALTPTQMRSWWLAYCHFQCGDYEVALSYFDQLLGLLGTADPHSELARQVDLWRLSRACCWYQLQRLEDAERDALLTTRHPLCHRLLYLISARRQNGDKVLLERYRQLSSQCIEDQLALASTSFARGNYQEAIEIYKRLATEHRDRVGAVHLYLALCYFHLDYYDVALELLAVYAEAHKDSFAASNLKAACQFRLYSGVEATQELVAFSTRNPQHPCNAGPDDDPMGTRGVFEHNMAVFEDASGGYGPAPTRNVLSTLPPLVGVLAPAKINLVLAYLHRHRYREAFELVEDLEPTTTVEHCVKGVLHAMIGEQTHSKEHVFLAEKHFHAIGSSSSECDTIPGRQCMASYHLVRKEFDEANVYLKSIATYLISSDVFNWNYGMALAAAGHFAEAEDVLMRVGSERLRRDYVYCGWLARAQIRNRRNASQAWELYLKMENTADAFKLLRLIADEYYRASNFYYAVKAFDVLERLDPDPEYWEAKRGACVGYFRQVAMGQEPLAPQRCEDVVGLLLASKNVIESNRLGTMLKKWVQSITAASYPTTAKSMAGGAKRQQ